MLRNYLLSAFRNIVRHRWYVLINLVGLSLGITLALILFFHLTVEYGFDSQVPDRDRVYRLVRVHPSGGGSAELSPMLAEQLKQQFNEIELCARAVASGRTVYYQEKDGIRTSHMIEGGYFADSTFFSLFGIEPLYGDPNLSLRDPETMVITESVAKRIFGNEIPVGQQLIRGNDNLRRITAVIPDPPFDSHIQYEILYPMVTYERFMLENRPELWQSRTWSGVLNYIKLQPETSIRSVEARLDEFLQIFFASDEVEDEEYLASYQFQPLTSIHLQPSFSDDNGPRTNVIYLRILGVVGMVILLIAAINFINISLALGLRRVREVGIRKVMGAEKRQIGLQFLLETGMLILLAGLFSMLLVELVFPTYIHLTGYPLESSQLYQLDYLPVFLAILTFLLLAGGIFPALHASTFEPAQSIRVGRDPRAIVGTLRKGLLIFQFAISSAAIFCTLVIYMQSEFLLNRDPGFDMDHVLVVSTAGELRNDVFDHKSEVKAELRKRPGILSVSFASALPGDHYSGEALYTEGVEPDTWPGVRILRGDPDIVETLGLELAEGKSFAGLSPETPAFLPNETAVRTLGLENPVGKPAWNNIWGPFEGSIMGVLRDFNYASLQEPIGALVVENRPDGTRYMLVRVQGGATQDAVRWVENVFETRVPNGYYELGFLDERLQQLYTSEKNLSTIFRLFGSLGIAISALGLLGMTSLLVYSKQREIGIRKVLGASELSIHKLVTSTFLIHVLVANLVALPLSAFLMQRWLEHFAYHITISWAFYPLTFVLSFLIALVAMLSVTITAARTNPVEVLHVNA